MKTDFAPDEILDTKDRGDDTQARFRYQNSCSCIVSINMLNDECPYQEVLCEQHEDILLKLNNGKFAGVQIKTRDADLGPFSIKDDAIIKSISRFVDLDKRFPNYFDYYVIASNVGFAKTSSVDIRELVDDAKKNNIDINTRSNYTTLIKQISNNLKTSTDEVLFTIKKIRIRKPMPQISDIEDKILSTLYENKVLARTLIRVVKKIINDIIILHYHAGSLKISDIAYEYYVFESDYKKDEAKLIVDSKKIDKKKLEDIINHNIGNENLIHPRTKYSILDFRPSTYKLEAKLDAGDINIENVNILKEDKYAFEIFMTERFYKDEDRATKEYNHYRHMMLSECQDSYDRFDKKSVFGMDMLIDVKDRIRDRFKYNSEQLFDCTQEHLLGMVAILTEECQVWWSDKFEI